VSELAWPTALSLLSLTLNGVVETILVGRLGTSAIAATGLSMSLSFAILAFGNGLLRGVKVSASQKVGAGDVAGSDRLVWQGLWVALLTGLALMVFAPILPVALHLISPSDDVARLATVHAVIRVLGAPLYFATGALWSWLQARERARAAMIAMLVQNGSQILFAILLVPLFGVAGAGFATVLSWLVGAIAYAIPVRDELRRTSPRPDYGLIREVVVLGAPLGAQFSLDVASFAVFAALLARVGEADLAAHVIALRINSVSFLPGFAVAEAAAVLVGQATGAGRPDLAKRAFQNALIVAVAVMGAGGALFLLAPGPLVWLFEASPEVAPIAITLLRIAAVFQLFDAIATVAFSSLAGAGDTRFSMVMGVLVAWMVKIPLGFVLAVPLGGGAAGAWLGLTLEIAVLAVVGCWRVLALTDSLPVWFSTSSLAASFLRLRAVPTR
jgi:MATE family multidrug resistance protein